MLRFNDSINYVQYIWMTALLSTSAAMSLKQSILREQILKDIDIKQRPEQY